MFVGIPKKKLVLNQTPPGDNTVKSAKMDFHSNAPSDWFSLTHQITPQLVKHLHVTGASNPHMWQHICLQFTVTETWWFSLEEILFHLHVFLCVTTIFCPVHLCPTRTTNPPETFFWNPWRAFLLWNAEASFVKSCLVDSSHATKWLNIHTDTHIYTNTHTPSTVVCFDVCGQSLKPHTENKTIGVFTEQVLSVYYCVSPCGPSQFL